MAVTDDMSNEVRASETSNLLVLSVGGFLVFLLAALGVEMTRAAGNVASIWLPNIVAIAMLYRLSGLWRPVGVLVAFAAIVLANLSFGDPVSVSVGLAAANAVDFTLGYLLLRYLKVDRESVLKTDGFIKLLLAVGLVSPSLSALVGAGVLNHFYDAPFANVAWTWWLSSVVGAVVLGPAVIAPANLEIFQRPLAFWEVIGWAAAATLLVWAVSLTGAHLLVYLCPVLVVFAGIRVGLLASGFSGSLFAVYLAWVIVSAEDKTNTLFAGNLLEVQTFLLATMMLAHAVAMLWHQRIQAEAGLARYVNALEDTEEAIVFVDADLKPLSWNASMQRLLPGIGALPSGGRQNYKDENLAIFGQLRAGKNVVNQASLRAIGDGSSRHFLINARATYSGGLMDGAIMRYRDVTKEVELQQTVEARIAELEAFLDASDDAVLGTDAEGRINIINKVACAFHGVDRDKALGMSIFDLDEDPDGAMVRFHELMSSGNAAHTRLKRRNAEGELREVERSHTPILDRHGEVVGVAGVQRDLTDIVEMGHAVDRKEVLLDKILTSVTDAIAIFDGDEILVRCNTAYASNIGHQDDSELIGRHWVEISRSNVDRGVVDIGEQDFDEWIAERRRHRFTEDGNRIIAMPNGQWHLGRDYPTDDGGFVAIRQDITDLKDAQDELGRSNEELEQFAFVASHDLQEPLRKISAFGSILVDEYADTLDEDGQRYLNSMISGAARMQTLIRDLLTYSRLARDTKNLKLVNLGDVVEDVQDGLTILIREAGANVTVEPLGMALCNELEMSRVFQNLITNAIRYAARDRAPEVRIVAGAETDETFTVLVQDNGLGIEERFIDLIFQPFKRLHGQNAIPGTGMGLPIVRKILRSIGGEISVSSVPDEGSTFTITLPKPK